MRYLTQSVFGSVATSFYTDWTKLFIERFGKTDTISRYGGDAFAVILPQACKLETRTIAARLHEQLAQYPFDGNTVIASF